MVNLLHASSLLVWGILFLHLQVGSLISASSHPIEGSTSGGSVPTR